MSHNRKVSEIREEYTLGELTEDDLAATPIEQFSRWFDDALRYRVMEPNAMTLSTVSAEGSPASRIVLLKGFDHRGFVFFTNYKSRKGQDIVSNPRVALLFFWPELQRQVRIEGLVQKLEVDASDAYFHSRPIGSQLGAVASPQSQPVPDRAFLDLRLEKLTRDYADKPSIARPVHWGGYRVAPVRVEFWQGRANRMHDRLVFEPAPSIAQSSETEHSPHITPKTKWSVRRLAP